MIHYSLSALYDADRRTTDPEARSLAAKVMIPHPLYEVQYADGIKRDTTMGRIHTWKTP